MRKPRKIQIIEKITEIPCSYFEGSLAYVQNSLQELGLKHLNYHNLKLSWSYGYQDETVFELYGDREETDKECAARYTALEKVKAAKKATKEVERETKRKLYEQLKKELGLDA